MVFAAAAKAASVAALLPVSQMWLTLSRHSSQTAGAPGAAAPAVEVTAGSASNAISIASAASRASSSVSATTSAIGSPT